MNCKSITEAAIEIIHIVHLFIMISMSTVYNPCSEFTKLTENEFCLKFQVLILSLSAFSISDYLAIHKIVKTKFCLKYDFKLETGTLFSQVFSKSLKHYIT